MSIKEVDTEKLAKEICTRINRGDSTVIKDAIEAHNPVEENIVRPADVVAMGIYKKIVVRKCDHERANKRSLEDGCIGTWNESHGYSHGRFACYVTPNGKPVTGYEDD